MRYDNGKDWVSVKGVAQLPMRELAQVDAPDIVAGHAAAVKLTEDAHFTDHAGQVVDWRGDILGLTVQQWNWWKGCIWRAARDERVDPEA